MSLRETGTSGTACSAGAAGIKESLPGPQGGPCAHRPSVSRANAGYIRLTINLAAVASALSVGSG